MADTAVTCCGLQYEHRVGYRLSLIAAYSGATKYRLIRVVYSVRSFSAALEEIKATY